MSERVTCRVGLPGAPASTCAEVRRAVCEHTGVTEHDLIGEARHPRTVRARRLYAVLCRRWTLASYQEIARSLHRSSHSPFVEAVRWYEAGRESGELPEGFEGDLSGCERVLRDGRSE